MPQLLPLYRAARLADVTRGELQKRIREEGVKTFEGMLTVELLLELYPHIDIESDPVLERVQKIKSEARPRIHHSDGLIPDPEVLTTRLKHFQHTLVQTKSALNAAESLMQETLDDLNAALASPVEQLRIQVAQSIARLEKTMQQAERVNDTRAALFAKNALLKLVTASIRLLPSGHEFFLEGNDSILDAGLKAGLYLDYGCTSGNCGACKCKVVSGAIRKLQEHDYVISASEQEEGYILACSNTAISDLVIEASEAGMEEELPYQEIRAMVRKIEPVGEDLALIHVQTPRTHTLRFKAGQQVKLTAENGNDTDLCIASCPCDGRNLQFIVARNNKDDFSKIVFDGTLSNQTLFLQGPTGDFVLRDDSTAPALFIANGTGFAPIKSLVEQAITIDNAEGLQLIQLGGNPAGSSLDNLCRSWNDALDNFVYTATAPDISIVELSELLTAVISDTPRTDVYIAGPSDWVETLFGAARSKGLDPATWHHWVVG